jgi:Carboxypeptidase regulatory-like domain/TonB-dependent Receptor Plug Domain
MQCRRTREMDLSAGKGPGNDGVNKGSLQEGLRSAWRSRLLGFVAMAGMLFGPAYGQSTTGSIFGTITDPSGGVIPSSTVTATDLKTGILRTAQTNASGNYVFPSMPPGDYAISATATSFAKQTKSGVHVDVNQSAEASFQMSLGNTAETVTVTAGGGLIETRESQLGETVDQKRIEDLPLNGRDVSSLVQLVPGVTDYGAQNAGGNQFGTTFSVNGTRTNQDSFYLDGAFDNSLFITGGNLLPNPDALLEFRLLTNNFDAEFGRFPGGVVNVVTRSGGNAFHGSLYDYLRNDALNSKNFFQTTITPLKQNQFGGTFGGPILHDKAFFFGSYEGLRISTPTIIAPGSISTPTAAEAAGDFSALSPANRPNVSCNGVSGVICPNQLDPVAQALLKQVPLANSTTGLTPQQSAAGNTTANQYLVHLDYAWTKSHQLSGSFFQSLSNSENANQGGNQILTYSGGVGTDNQTNVAISDVWTISPNKLNTFRPFYTLNHYNLTNLYNGNVGWAPFGSHTGLGALPATQPQIAINGYFTMGMGSGGPDDLHQQSFGAEDTFNWDLGNHSVRLGGSYFWNRYAEQGEYLGTGEATFSGFATGNALADFLLGRAATFRQNNGASHSLHSPAPSLFAQDDWRATRKLTLNLGLRWEVFAPFSGQNNFGTFVAGVQSKRFPNAPLGLLTAGDPGVPDGIVKTKYNDFSPRVGFAYDVFGDGKTAVRGAYGIFYAARAVSLTTNPEQQPFILDNTITNTPNLTTPYTPNADPFPYVVNLQNPQFLSGATLSSIPLSAGTPYVQEFNLTLEQQLSSAWALRVAYVGNLSREFYLSRDQNAPVYFPGASTSTAALNARRPYQPTPNSYVFGSIVENDPANNASYDALQVTLTHRFAHGFSLLASYVWSKSIDISSGDPSNITLTLSNQNDLAADRGLSNFDVPQRFVASYLYQTPKVNRFGLLGKEVLGNWQLNGITTISTGTPFTVTSGVDSNLDSVQTDRPNTVANPVVPGGRSRTAKITEFFNTAAFAQVPAGVPYGNTGRNSLVGPGIVNTDFSAFKNLPVWGESYFQFRAEFFNLFNNVNLDNPTAVLTSPLNGQISGSAPARVIQFALKYNF